MGKKNKGDFDKYYFYENSVQNPPHEAEFLDKEFERIRGRKAVSLKEDFCGTALISLEWIKKGKERKAIGIDLDPEPIEYSKENHLPKLTADQQERMIYMEKDVLKIKKLGVDVTFAFNFSYFIFHERKTLLNYFKSVYENLNDDGVFFLDLFGGPDSQTLCEDVIQHDKFKYYWECKSFNPLTNNCLFSIHFKRKGEKKREDVFTYNWRMWTAPEICDILKDAGFSKTETYWEEDDPDSDEGNGVFYPTDEVENCQSWVSYISAIK